MNELPSIQQLECFIIYGRIPNFTQAAAEANITQSAFSMQIKKLERQLGVRLIERSNRGSHLTPAGEHFLVDAQQWMNGLRQIVAKTQSEASRTPVTLHIGVLRSLGDVLMNQHITYFQQHHKDISLTVYDMTADDLLDALRNDHIDLASTHLLRADALKDYEKIHFFWDRMVYFAPAVTGLPDFVSISDIQSQPLVSYPQNDFMNTVIRDYFQPHGGMPPMAARLATPYAMMHYCCHNRAGALLSERLLHELDPDASSHPLAQELRLDSCTVYRKNHPKRKAIEIYVRYICQHFHCSSAPLP